MMTRTQILLDAEVHRKARRRAAQLGVSLAEYVRRLLARDLADTTPHGDPSVVFALGDSGGTDVAREKDQLIGRAVAERRRR